MGVTSSKQDAFIGNNNHRSSSKDDESPCSSSCFSFCPPSPHNQQQQTNNNNKSSYRQNSFGSPLPDTPEQVRRIRDHDSEYYTTNGQVVNNGANANNNHSCSKYGGLERELSGMFLNEMDTTTTTAENGSGEDHCAEIHDGKVSVKIYNGQLL